MLQSVAGIYQFNSASSFSVFPFPVLKFLQPYFLQPYFYSPQIKDPASPYDPERITGYGKRRTEKENEKVGKTKHPASAIYQSMQGIVSDEKSASI
jgi:hypothetical protein